MAKERIQTNSLSLAFTIDTHLSSICTYQWTKPENHKYYVFSQFLWITSNGNLQSKHFCLQIYKETQVEFEHNYQTSRVIFQFLLVKLDPFCNMLNDLSHKNQIWKCPLCLHLDKTKQTPHTAARSPYPLTAIEISFDVAAESFMVLRNSCRKNCTETFTRKTNK